MDGNYSLNVTNGIYTLSIKYIGYKDIVVNNVKSGKADVVLNFELESDAQTLGEVSVVARKNLEGERALQMERRKATLAIENIGSKENEHQRYKQCRRRGKKRLPVSPLPMPASSLYGDWATDTARLP